MRSLDYRFDTLHLSDPLEISRNYDPSIHKKEITEVFCQYLSSPGVTLVLAGFPQVQIMPVLILYGSLCPPS